MRQFSLPEAAQQVLSLFQSGRITVEECDVAIALYIQMDREFPRYKLIQTGENSFETVTLH